VLAGNSRTRRPLLRQRQLEPEPPPKGPSRFFDAWAVANGNSALRICQQYVISMCHTVFDLLEVIAAV